MDKIELSKAIENAVKGALFKDITLDIARKVSEEVRKKAAEIGVKAVVAVANSGARPI